MTDEEALALKPGDKIGYVAPGPKREVSYVLTVTQLPYETVGGSIYVSCRRPGRNAKGVRWGETAFAARNLRLIDRYDPATANVYADWLDEAGFAEAALALRRAFPLDPGVRATG